MERYPVNRTFAVAAIAFHIGAIVALFFVTWNLFLLSLVAWYVFGCLGITLIYHRYLTHDGFKTYSWFRKALSVIACLPLQGGPIRWVAWHRLHHKYSDVPGKDPHTPRDGKYWAHMDWMVHQDPAIDTEEFFAKWARDLYSDPFYRKLERFFWVPIVLWGVGCLLLGGFPAVLWGVAVPITTGWHFTWLINSATHIWGKRRFETRDNSRNNRWVALLTWGEGWHNNHHEDPMRARHGIVWWEPDPTWYTIKLLEFCGLIWDVRN